MSYLRNRTTGEIYPMNEHLMRRGDFEEVDSPDAARAEAPEPEVVIAPAAKPKRTTKPKKAAPVVEMPKEEAPEVEAVEVDELLDELTDLDLGDDE